MVRFSCDNGSTGYKETVAEFLKKIYETGRDGSVQVEVKWGWNGILSPWSVGDARNGGNFFGKTESKRLVGSTQNERACVKVRLVLQSVHLFFITKM